MECIFEDGRVCKVMERMKKRGQKLKDDAVPSDRLCELCIKYDSAKASSPENMMAGLGEAIPKAMDAMVGRLKRPAGYVQGSEKGIEDLLMKAKDDSSVRETAIAEIVVLKSRGLVLDDTMTRLYEGLVKLRESA